MFTNIGGVARYELYARNVMEEKDQAGHGSVQSPALDSESRVLENQYKVYPSRFYVLIVFSLFALVQSLGWLTFGTIPSESYREFGLTDDDITLIAGVWLVLWLAAYLEHRCRNKKQNTLEVQTTTPYSMSFVVVCYSVYLSTRFNCSV